MTNSAGTLAFVGGAPGVAAEGEKILVYTGNDAVFQGYTRFAEAVGLELETSSSLPEDLSTYACIVLPVNRMSFSAPMTEAFVSYLEEGGNLLALGDRSGYMTGSHNTTMNELASAAGSSMSLTSQDFDVDDQVTREIDPSPLTDGVAAIGYASTTGVTIPVGGTAQSLVRSKAGSQAPGTIIIAAETIGDGLFVLSGDSNAFSDFVLDLYTNNDNGVLARNLCLGPQQEQEYSFDGFSGPVEAGVVNTVKGGSTVPLKFRVFEGDIEVTDPAVVASFTVTPMTCPDADTPSDEVEFTTMGKTELRYTDGTFQQNWKTPKVKGCYQVTVATTDGATLSADFVLR